MKEYPYRKMNEMREILEVLQMPSKLKNTRTILTLLAVARVKEKSKWSQVEESYARTHDMIVFMNMLQRHLIIVTLNIILIKVEQI